MNGFSYDLLSWYDQHQRILPWRALPGQSPDPYKVWISEIMLQQTTVATVKSYFRSFLKKWPRVEDLASAPLDDILHAWQGLGYYARARNLHKCAKMLVDVYGGKFPETEQELLKLPGIGPYTAAAILAIAFNKKATVVDGNIERITSRIFAIETPLPQAKPEIKEKLTPHVSKERPGDFAQALMDIGATICTPYLPKCDQCPLKAHCRAREENLIHALPKKQAKEKKPHKFATVFWLENTYGEVLIQKRPPHGLLGGLMEFPSTPWTTTPNSLEEDIKYLDVKNWQLLDESVTHTFTHFHLHLRVVKAASKKEGLWCHPKDFKDYAFPTLMKKVMKAA